MGLDGHTHPLHQQREDIKHLHLCITLMAVKQHMKQLGRALRQELCVHGREGGREGGSEVNIRESLAQSTCCIATRDT